MCCVYCMLSFGKPLKVMLVWQALDTFVLCWCCLLVYVMYTYAHYMSVRILGDTFPRLAN